MTERIIGVDVNTPQTFRVLSGREAYRRAEEFARISEQWAIRSEDSAEQSRGYAETAADLIAEFDPGGGGGGPVEWGSIEGKPDVFPPVEHTHEIAGVVGLTEALEAATAAARWDDVVGKPNMFPPAEHTHDEYLTADDLPDPPEPPDLSRYVEDDDDRLTDARTPTAHTHTVQDVDGLEDTLTGLQDAVDTPPAPVEWGDIEGKPTQFPPAGHAHAQYLTEADLPEPPDFSGFVQTTDHRLTDERPPTAHSHTVEDVDTLEDRLSALEADTGGGGEEVVFGGRIFIQEDEPQNPRTGDVHLW